MAPTVLASIGLGANLGEPLATLARALDELARLAQSTLVAQSPIYRSAPIEASGPDFFNAVAQLRTGLSAQALLAELQRIETVHGRERSYRNAPRTLDLDLLLFGDECIAEPGLIVPHPRMQQRAFVLRPLADIAPDTVIPGLGSVSDWLPQVAGQRIEKLSETAS
jgi:2-amino-4-hydroxy-6-hydroxymethyldihydropteridine diphosphokinase